MQLSLWQWGLLKPLRARDFAVLWAGMSVSLLGDGFYNVAIAWQVYQIANTPAALGAVGAAFTLPRVLMLSLGGVLSDRHDRRRLMLIANLEGCASIAVLGALSIAGRLQLWEVFCLVAIYGLSAAIFLPAFTAVVPELVPSELLSNAQALDQFVRNVAGWLIGPALAGIAISLAGTGEAFILDAASFAFAALTVVLMRPPEQGAPQQSVLSTQDQTPRPASTLGTWHSALARDLLEGLRYVLRVPWLWATMFMAGALSTTLLFGPAQVLLPWVIKNRLDGSAADLGWVLAAGGLGGVLASAAMAQRPLPRHAGILMYLGWAVWGAPVVIYGLATNAWLLALAGFVRVAGLGIGQITWFTLMQTHVPPRLLGRVSALDWQLTLGLTPLSYALTGPVAAAIGPSTTLIGAGLLGTAFMLLPLAIPGVRHLEAR